MNVKQLIERLQEQDPNAEVVFTYNYGDFWRTTVAPTVESVDVAHVTFSEYHSMDKLVVRDEDDRAEDVRTVVALG